MKYMGVDYGDKHIGISVSDDGGNMAFPLKTLSNDAGLIEEIRKIVKENKIEEMIVGESKDFKGNENPIMVKAKEFAEQVRSEIGIPVSFELEFLTSVEARHIQGGGDKTHASASAIILQSYLDKKK